MVSQVSKISNILDLSYHLILKIRHEFDQFPLGGNVSSEVY